MATKTKKKPAKAAAKKSTKKKAAKATKPIDSTPVADPCAAGHDYETDGEGKEYCKTCLADRSVIEKQTKNKAKGQKLAKAKKAKGEVEGEGKLSAIDAAAKLLGETKEPMTTKEMIEQMATKGYWTSPGGKTPAATLYSAILREIQTKGAEGRFVKTERGKFQINA